MADQGNAKEIPLGQYSSTIHLLQIRDRLRKGDRSQITADSGFLYGVAARIRSHCGDIKLDGVLAWDLSEYPELGSEDAGLIEELASSMQRPGARFLELAVVLDQLGEKIVGWKPSSK